MEHYLTIAVFVLLAGLLVWGGRFPGKGKRFHEDWLGKDSTGSLRGLAAICVILHHISQEEAMQNAGELTPFVQAGYLFVAIFFFCSGFGLMKNLKTREDYLNGFLRQRLPVLLVPFFVSAVLYLPFRLFAMGETMAPMQIVTGLLGLTLMNEYAWYPVVLLVLYLVFYLVFRRTENRKKGILALSLTVILMGAFFCVNGHFAWWAKEGDWWIRGRGFSDAPWWMQQKTFLFSGEWWVNAASAFIVGLVIADNEERFTAWLKKLYWLKLPVTGALFFGARWFSEFVQEKTGGYWSEFSGHGPHIGDKALCLLAQQPEIIFFVLFIAMLLLVFRAENPVTRFFSKISLETYLMNLMGISAFRFLLGGKPGGWKLALYAVCVLASTVLLALPFKLLCGKLISIIRRKPAAPPENAEPLR